MLEIRTKKRIKEHKWNQHSNKSQFFQRLKKKSHAALDDLTLIAENLDDEQLQEIFTVDKLEPFARALMAPELTRRNRTPKYKRDKDRIFFLSFMYLKWSLDTLGTVIDNRWAQETYSQHQQPVRNIANTLWHERMIKLKKKS